MSQTVSTILSALSIAAGALGTLVILGFTVAGMPNSSPQQLHRMKLFMIGATVVGLLSLAGGIVLLIKGHPGWAAMLGAIPIIFIFGVIVWLFIQELF